MQVIEIVLGIAAIVGAFSGLAAWIAQLSRQSYAREREMAHLKADVQTIALKIGELMDLIEDKDN